MNRQERTTIGGLMLVILATAVVLGLARFDQVSIVVFFASLLVLGGPISKLVEIPIRLRRNHVIPLVRDFHAIDRDGPDFPEALLARFRRAGGDLEALGFECLGHFRADRVLALEGFLALYVNRRDKVEARFLSNMGPRGVNNSMIVFRSRLDDGTLVATSDNDSMNFVPQTRPKRVVIWIPEVQSSRRLYEIHQGLLRTVAGSPILPAGSAIDQLGSTMSEERARWVQTGYYEEVEGRGMLRLTWKGAIFGTFKMIGPIKSIRRWLRNKRSLATVRRLERDGFLAVEAA